LYVRLPEVSVADLKEAWMAVVRQASLNKHHKIGREELSVREHMGIILRLLAGAWRLRAVRNDVRPGMGAPGLVVHFLAMLELAREKLVEFTQSEAFEPIYVRVHQGGSEPGQESA
jgi:segregation and condensation protein A